VVDIHEIKTVPRNIGEGFMTVADIREGTIDIFNDRNNITLQVDSSKSYFDPLNP
jgi:hypothetical protein